MSGNADNRPKISEHNFDMALASVIAKLEYRRKQKGDGIMMSSHEILGIMEEELYEYKKALHDKTAAQYKKDELIDIAVAALFGIASFNSEKMDW